MAQYREICEGGGMASFEHRTGAIKHLTVGHGARPTTIGAQR